MSLNDGEMHAVAGVGVGLLTGALVFVMIASGWSSCGRADASEDRDPLEDMVAIEASLAYRSSPKQKQPQKKTRQPEATKKADGVSRDENKKPPDEKKPDDTKKTSTNPNDFKIPDRRPDEDLPVNDKPVTDVGEFNDNEKGYASVNTGDPWFGRLAGQFQVEFPSTEEASAAAGCVHILADGTIKKFKIDPRSDNDALNTAIEAALKTMQQERNAEPEDRRKVPTLLLKQATTRWICFKIDAQQKVGP